MTSQKNKGKRASKRPLNKPIEKNNFKTVHPNEKAGAKAGFFLRVHASV
jgi:hypothetical protein